MAQNRIQINSHVRSVLVLALPLVLAEVGWMFMAVVDTIMVGHLPHPAITISAVALAQVLYNTLAFGIGGILLGLDTYLSQSHGAGKLEEANGWLLHGVLLAAILSAVLMAVVYAASFALLRFPVDPIIRTQAATFLRVLNLGTPPLLLALTLRRYLQAFNHVRPIAIALVTANVVNAVLDWLFLFPHSWFAHSRGQLTLPGHGVVGAAISTSLARLYLAACFAIAIWFFDGRHSYGLRTVSRRIEASRLKQLALYGAPVGAQIFVEISIFGTVTYIIGIFGPLPLAGHEIALNIASITFMVPFAISAAASVRVGQAIGRKAPAEASAAGYTAIGLGAAFMLCASAALVVAPRLIARAFTADRAVIAAAVPLLLVAAAFQFFDGVQVTATGALRGAGNTHTGLIVHLCGYWLIGMPVGVVLAFHFKLGAVGLWSGLCAGLVVAAGALLRSWQKTSRAIATTIPMHSPDRLIPD
jgi:MATE family multidrug resistance protein